MSKNSPSKARHINRLHRSAPAKTSIVILCILVTLSLVISIVTLFFVVNHSVLKPSAPSNNPSPLPHPTPYLTTTPTTLPTEPITNTPQPTQPPSPDSQLTVSYTETSRENVNNASYRVVLTVNIAYQQGGEFTLTYSQFYLQLYAPRMIYYMYEGTVAPQNSGAFTIGPSHTNQQFQLTFEYPQITFNGMDDAGTSYQLKYNGSAIVQFTNQDYH